MRSGVGVLLVATSAAAVTMALALAAPLAAQQPVTAFTHVTVIPMDRERVLKDQTVVIRDGRIVALGPARTVRVPADAVQIDGRDQFLVPGLSDMHVHLRSLLPTGSDSARQHAERTLDDVLFMLLATGVTTIRDMHSGGGEPDERSQALGHWVLALRERLARGERLGPRLYTAGDPDYSAPAAAAASVAKLKADGHDFVKVYATDRRPAAVYDSIVASARRVGLRMVGHAPQGGSAGDGRSVGWALAAPYASIEHRLLWSYLEGVDTISESTPEYHGYNFPWTKPGYHPDPAKLRATVLAVKRAGTWLDPTLAGPMFMAGGERIALLQPLMFRALWDAGVGLLTGTDYEPGSSRTLPLLVRPSLLGLTEPTVFSQLELLVASGLTSYEALAASTRNAADFLGTLDSAGTIAVGKWADLVLVTADPLRDISHLRLVGGVMIGGRWLPEAELRTRVEQIRAATVR